MIFSSKSHLTKIPVRENVPGFFCRIGSFDSIQFHTIKMLWEDLTAAGKENGNIRQEKYAGFHLKGCVKRLNHVKLM